MEMEKKEPVCCYRGGVQVIERERHTMKYEQNRRIARYHFAFRQQKKIMTAIKQKKRRRKKCEMRKKRYDQDTGKSKHESKLANWCRRTYHSRFKTPET